MSAPALALRTGFSAAAVASSVVAALAVGYASVDAAHLWRAYAAREGARGAGEAAAAAIATATAAVRAATDSIRIARAVAPPDSAKPVVIVSLVDNRLWVRGGQEELFSTRVATGSGRTLVGSGRKEQYRFDTPRGKLTVLSKETTPAWVPPDWHFVEKASKRGTSVLRMKRGQVIPVSDGVITTRGSEVIKRRGDGSVQVLAASDGRELTAGGRVIIPPFGTNARRYKEILGTHRLNLGDGYALHGTNAPSTVGRSVSHGCVRLRNEDIETLYRMIPVGSAVYIY